MSALPNRLLQIAFLSISHLSCWFYDFFQNFLGNLENNFFLSLIAARRSSLVCGTDYTRKDNDPIFRLVSIFGRISGNLQTNVQVGEIRIGTTFTVYDNMQCGVFSAKKERKNKLSLTIVYVFQIEKS